MATQHLHRLIVILPVANVAAVGTWWAANVDPNDNCTTWPGLNATGLKTDPLTHRWASMGLKDTDFRQIIVKVCQLASVTPPVVGTWNGWTVAQKRDWLAATRVALYTAVGIWLAWSFNDGVWGDPQAELLTRGLKTATR